MRAYKSKIYGFEDYTLYGLNGDVFYLQADMYRFSKVEQCFMTYLFPDNIVEKDRYNTTDIDILFKQEANHPELLSSAKKLFIHPNCKISRTIIYNKYSKSLNPYLSDAIVIPQDYKSLYLNHTSVLLFVNESKKVILMFGLYDDDFDNNIKSSPEGTKFSELVCQDISSYAENVQPLTLSDIMDSELMYAGDMLYFDNQHSYIVDILTGKLPYDKLVHEESLLESLKDEDNQITLDNLLSIKDMLSSSDPSTVAAALKALSMMDYTHYSNSILTMMGDGGVLYNFKYNRAMKLTSVKYMINQLFSTNRRSRIWVRYSNDIYKEDYDLLCQLLKQKYNCEDSEVWDNLLQCYPPFIRYDEEGKPFINFKK